MIGLQLNLPLAQVKPVQEAIKYIAGRIVQGGVKTGFGFRRYA